ncbi:hypothetical protein GDO81_009261 [Engystomops pustulosus]|uniref:Uncharacterized protein n=1 Tax=Engystomops pustulosus TaxID=76066 RepID=A0AAV7BQ37_ENGPU|nr:hypothetical protein GDO81_009261 [Engystomops pustulosus]
MYPAHGCSSHPAQGAGCDGCCTGASPGVRETVQEMDFQRGIWSAAMDGDLKRVQRFVEKGTDPNLADNFGYTALAAEGGHRDLSLYLLHRYKGLLELRDGRGHTAADLAPSSIAQVFLSQDENV